MLVITRKINEILKRKNLSCHKLSQLVNYKISSFDEMVKGKRPFPGHVIERLLPILEVSQEEFEGWILTDKYSREIIELAIKAKKEACCHFERSKEYHGSFAITQDDPPCHCEPPKEAWQSNNSSDKSDNTEQERLVRHCIPRNDNAKDKDINKLILTTKIDSILQEKGISRTSLSKQINYNQSALNAIITGKRTMSKTVLERLAKVLKISQNEIMSCIIADKYNLKTLKFAVKEKNE
ncbi:MAG: hypothetical protein A2287_03505 [Candidatus Melainabacteria bacterium RIFOXYA12_FULL_32_12]|nr:MAG: hypothetical protein A2255_10995 [Candidatus Melainabacteria bacterium RIFOXYA2_FULL_32_9]OGI28485.1 MAG: hypothetical protein A2287_03505 [Candidatus Melainabacteria bacterium RIFOXYA12_FULL_32_12]